MTSDSESWEMRSRGYDEERQCPYARQEEYQKGHMHLEEDLSWPVVGHDVDDGRRKLAFEAVANICMRLATSKADYKNNVKGIPYFWEIVT
ncbi:hypothetical protein KUA11_17265, partial [Acetobacter estunensis]